MEFQGLVIEGSFELILLTRINNCPVKEKGESWQKSHEISFKTEQSKLCTLF